MTLSGVYSLSFMMQPSCCKHVKLRRSTQLQLAVSCNSETSIHDRRVSNCHRVALPYLPPVLPAMHPPPCEVQWEPLLPGGP